MGDAVTNIVLSRTDEGDGPPGPGPGLPPLPVLDEHRFVVGEERDRGGVGRVLVTHDRVLGRQVAVKQLQRAGDGAASARFLREALLTARLEHPAIVPVYDVGERASGEPFYAMRLVSGTSLRAAVDTAAGLDERLALLPHVVAVADAMAYAHGRGIVHRDLKPANVLVGPFGETLVIDWGLAKDLAADAPEPASSALDDAGLTADLTRVGAVMGTPGYMAPEQARGDAVDARTDVYALGALLYHVLAGCAPHDATGAAVVALTTREPGVPRDLAAIVTKAMAAAPEARYPSAKELAADLKAFATGQLVGARRYTRWGLLRRWVRRHRVTLLVAAALGAVLAVTAGASAVAVVRARDQARAEANRLRLLQAMAVVERDPTEAIAWLRRYTPEAGSATRVRDVAARAAAAGVARDVLTLPDETPLRVCLSPDGHQAGVVARSGAIWLFDRQKRTRRRVGTLGAAPEYCTFGPQGTYLAALAMRGGVQLAQLPDGDAAPLDLPTELWGLRVLGDGRLLVTARDNRVFVVDPETRAVSPPLALPAGTLTTIPAPDGASLFSSDSQGQLWRVPLATGAAAAAAPTVIGSWGSVIYGLTATLDGRYLVFGTRQEVVELDLATGKTRTHRVTDVPADPINARAVYGGAIFIGGPRLTVGHWSRETGQVRVLGEQGFYKTLRVSADGARAVWVDLAGLIHVADLEEGVVTRLVGHHTAVRDIHITTDGRWLATTHGAAARLFELPAPRSRSFVVGTAETHVRPIPARGLVVVAEHGTRLATYHEATGTRRVLGETGGAGVWSLTVHKSGRWVAAGLSDGRVLLADLDAGTLVERGRLSVQAESLAFAGDELLAVDAYVLVAWPIFAGPRRTIARLGERPATSMGSPHIVVSDDGKRVLASTLRWGIVVDLADGATHPLAAVSSSLFISKLLPGAARVVHGLADGRVIVQDVDDGEIVELGRQDGFVNRLELTADGAGVVATGESGQVQIFALAGGQPPRTLGAHDMRVHVSAQSPGGTRLATADLSGHLRVWEPGSAGAAVLVVRDDVEPHWLAFVDEDHLATLDKRGQLRLWTLDAGALVPAEPAALAAWLGERSAAHLGGAAGGLVSDFVDVP